MHAVDTNVLVYSIDKHDRIKRAKARKLLNDLRTGSTPTYLMWQVAGELSSQLQNWQDHGRIKRTAVRRYVTLFRRLFSLVLPTPHVIDLALDPSKRYSLSHWDSMLVAACVEAQAVKLCTENMGAPRTIGSLELVNPFI
jgi:predicted nucleic acid-binding protein